jgi:hypothetical protein
MMNHFQGPVHQRKSRVYFQLLTLLKEFGLLYNTSPKLTKKHIKKLQEELTKLAEDL